MTLCAFSYRLAGMLGILARLRKVRIRPLDQWILIPMPELLLQPDISRDIMLLRFHCAFCGILIFRIHTRAPLDRRNMMSKLEWLFGKQVYAIESSIRIVSREIYETNPAAALPVLRPQLIHHG